MNVEIGAEAALFPGKKYISGIFLAVFGACAVRTYLEILEWVVVAAKHILQRVLNVRRSVSLHQA